VATFDQRLSSPAQLSVGVGVTIRFGSLVIPVFVQPESGMKSTLERPDERVRVL